MHSGIPTTQAEIDNLNRALQQGGGTAQMGKSFTIGYPGINPGSGGALFFESLERTLKNTSFGMRDIVLWKLLPQKKAYQTVEKVDVLQSYGGNLDQIFFPEGGAPNEDSSVYTQITDIVKYVGLQASVTHPATISQSIVNVIAQETISRTMQLLRGLCKACYYGDSNLSPLQFDGLVKKIYQMSPTSNIIDKRGAPLNEDDLNDGATQIRAAPAFGNATHILMDTKVKGDLIKSFFPKERVPIMQGNTGFGGANGAVVGGNIRGFDSLAGFVEFADDPFISDYSTPMATAVGNPVAIPLPPTISTPIAAGAPPAGKTSQFDSTNDAGPYYYYIVACNSAGKSAPVLVNSSAQNVAAGQAVTFGVTPAAGPGTDYYEVQRTPVGGAQGSQQVIQRVSNNLAGVDSVAPITITDLNDHLPGTTIAIMIQMDEDTVRFKSLCPMLKMPVGTRDTSIRWFQLIYGMLQLIAPKRVILYKNVGRAPALQPTLIAV